MKQAEERKRIDKAIDLFRQHMDPARLAEEMRLTPGAAAKLWRRARQMIAKERLNEGAAREFAAEMDEMFDALEGQMAQHLLTYGSIHDTEGHRKDTLSGYSALVKQMKEIRQSRYEMRQDLGLLPAGRLAAGRTSVAKPLAIGADGHPVAETPTPPPPPVPVAAPPGITEATPDESGLGGEPSISVDEVIPSATVDSVSELQIREDIAALQRLLVAKLKSQLGGGDTGAE